MDQQAKKHLQDEFDAALEEKDQMITVLQTQVSVWVCGYVRRYMLRTQPEFLILSSQESMNSCWAKKPTSIYTFAKSMAYKQHLPLFFCSELQHISWSLTTQGTK